MTDSFRKFVTTYSLGSNVAIIAQQKNRNIIMDFVQFLHKSERNSNI